MSPKRSKQDQRLWLAAAVAAAVLLMAAGLVFLALPAGASDQVGGISPWLALLASTPLALLAGWLVAYWFGVRLPRRYTDESPQELQDLQAYTRRLEEQISQRTQALQEANVALSTRAVQLQISSEVARQISSILDLNELLTAIANLIQRRYGYYFVGIWLASGGRRQLALQAGKGRKGDPYPVSGIELPIESVSAAATALRSGETLWIKDTRASLDYQPLGGLVDTTAQLCLPIRIGEVVTGVLDIQDDENDTISRDDVSLMQTLCDQIAIAIHNAQLYQAEQQRRRLAETLEEIGRELASSLEMGQVPGKVLEQLQLVAPYERGSVLLERRGELEIVQQRGFPDSERARQVRIPIRPGDVYQQVAEAHGAVRIADVSQEPGWQQLDWLPLNLSWMGVPLITRGKVIGMVSLTRKEENAFSQEDASIAQAFAGQAAIALENASLYEEIRQFSHRLETAYANLERLDKAKADFIAVAAHELRTPLTVLKGYTQVLGSRPSVLDDPETTALLEKMLDGQERLHEIINSMLDVSKIDNQTLSMHLGPTWLAMVIKRAVMEVGKAPQERQITLKIDNIEGLPYIQADSELLAKVFYHLLMNAIKYTPDGGSVTVSGELLLEEHSQPAVQITVSDTGIGINPADQVLIFEKFYQTGQVALHSSGKTKFRGGGPGLGLAIARGIVTAHGGKIWVESDGYDEQKCPGSRFHVLLPIRLDSGTGGLHKEN